MGTCLLQQTLKIKMHSFGCFENIICITSNLYVCAEVSLVNLLPQTATGYYKPVSQSSSTFPCSYFQLFRKDRHFSGVCMLGGRAYRSQVPSLVHTGAAQPTQKLKDLSQAPWNAGYMSQSLAVIFPSVPHLLSTQPGAENLDVRIWTSTSLSLQMNLFWFAAAKHIHLVITYFAFRLIKFNFPQ